MRLILNYTWTTHQKKIHETVRVCGFDFSLQQSEYV